MAHAIPPLDAEPTATRAESRPKRLRWHFKGVREQIALRLAPWLRTLRVSREDGEIGKRCRVSGQELYGMWRRVWEEHGARMSSWEQLGSEDPREACLWEEFAERLERKEPR